MSIPKVSIEAIRANQKPFMSPSASVSPCVQRCSLKKTVVDSSEHCEEDMQQEHKQRGREILQFLQAQCETGISEACEQEAWLYVKGHPSLFIVPDIDRGLKLMETFCQKGCEELAWAYEGRMPLQGIPIHPERALVFYERACVSGNTRACLREVSLQRELNLPVDRKKYQERLLQHCLQQPMEVPKRASPCDAWAKAKSEEQEESS